MFSRLVLVALKAYKALLSPLFAGSCRYLPSCSDYMAEAVERHGAAAGTALGLRRLARCHPLGGSGLDAVPEHGPWRALVSRRTLREPGTGPGGLPCSRRGGMEPEDVPAASPGANSPRKAGRASSVGASPATSA